MNPRYEAAYVQPMKDLLVEINSAHQLDLALSPSFSPIILDARIINIGYKIHSVGDPLRRIVSLIVSPMLFEERTDGTEQKIKAATKARMTRELRSFWDGQKTDHHAVIEITE